jgi:glycosyltransferase involved in cell wall biosynthesis
MRILNIITGLQTGGAERTLEKLVKAFPPERIQHVVVCLTSGGMVMESLQQAGAIVQEIGLSRSRLSVAALGRLSAALRRHDPDLLQGWMYHGNLACALAAWGRRDRWPLIWNIRHGLDDLRRETRSTRAVIHASALLSRRADRIVYNSQTSAAQHVSRGFAADRAQVIPNGFDCGHFRPRSEAGHRLRAELGLEPDSRIVGLLGRYHPAKDHATFLAAAGRLAARQPRVHFVLAGRGVDRANAELVRTIEAAQVADRVCLLGERRDMAELNAALDVATNCSRSESFANTIGEAMACSVPCVVTDVGESARLVGGTGRVVPVSDPDALAAAWSELLGLEPQRRQALGEAARRRIQEHFGLARFVTGFAELYAELLGRREVVPCAE